MVQMKLEGNVLLSSDADEGRAMRGFDVQLLGYVSNDTEKKAITRFDMVAVGAHWGRGQHTRNARPGRSPLGIAFELARGNTAEDRIPPQAARDFDIYLGLGR